ncbi:MAG: YceD family protein [Candidatus Rokuibacteriota bacterium]
MIIRVSELPGEGLTIDDPATVGSPYQDRSWHLDGVRLHVARDGIDVVVGGEINATVSQTCGRCLEAFPVTVQAAIDLRFMPRPVSADSLELSPDDFETDFYADDQLDLGAVVEAETTLALPMKPLCQPDCRGLCPVCGGNRNLITCACPERPSDPRLGGLAHRAARLDHSRSDH